MHSLLKMQDVINLYFTNLMYSFFIIELAYDTFLGQNPMNRQPFLMNSPAVGASAIDTTSPIVHSAGLFSTLPVGTSPHYEHLNAATAAAVAATAAVQHTQISPDRPPGLPYPFRFTTSHEVSIQALFQVFIGKK